MGFLKKLPFCRCFAETAAAFREQLRAEVESGKYRHSPGTLDLLERWHAQNRRMSLLYRLLDRSWLLPLGNFLDLCRKASDHIAEHGFFKGARIEIDRFNIALETEVSPEAQRLFDSGEPVLFVGNHPCIWGPDLWAVGASLEKLCPTRRGFIILTWTLVPAICPGMAPWSAQVIITARDIDRFTHDELGVADDRPAGDEALFRAFSPDIPNPRSREITYENLQNMARQWLEGEHAIIFPTGGAGTKARWFSGVGRVVRFGAEMLDAATPSDPHILFFRLEGASDFLMFAPPLLSRWHPLRVLRWIFTSGRIRVSFGESFRLRDYRERFLGMKNREVARFLEERFRHGAAGG